MDLVHAVHPDPYGTGIVAFGDAGLTESVVVTVPDCCGIVRREAAEPSVDVVGCGSRLAGGIDVIAVEVFDLASEFRRSTVGYNALKTISDEEACLG